MKTYVPASAVKVGDTLCFANPRHDVRIERISEARCDGSIGLHGNNDTWSSYYQPQNRVRILSNGVAHGRS
jgi:hypothetical protein